MINNLLNPPGSSLKETQADKVLSPESYFNICCARFKKARKETVRSANFFFMINGYTIKIVFAGAIRNYITAALDHIKYRPVKEPDLTVFCWDSTQSATSPPFIPWKSVFETSHRAVPLLNLNGIYISVSPASGALSIFSQKEKSALFFIKKASGLTSFERATPLKNILMWWLNSKGCFLIHAASIAKGNIGVLIAGPEGSGKSTTAMACIDNNLQYLGEDYVMVSSDQGYSAHSIYNSLKLNNNSLGKFPHLQDRVVNSAKTKYEKGIIFLYPGYQKKIIRSIKLRAIIIPIITQRSSSFIKKITQAQGFRALAPSTIFQYLGARRPIFGFIAEMTRVLPCFRIWLGSDLTEVAEQISLFIKQLSDESKTTC